MDKNSFDYGLDNAAQIPALVKEATDLIAAGNRADGLQKFEDALAINSATQAVLLLNLAKLAMEADNSAKSQELLELAYFTLETAGLSESVLAKTTLSLIALKPAADRATRQQRRAAERAATRGARRTR